MTMRSPMGAGFFIFFQDEGGGIAQKPKPKVRSWQPISPRREVFTKKVEALESQIVDAEIKLFFDEAQEKIQGELLRLKTDLKAADFELTEIIEEEKRSSDALALILILANI